MTTQIGPPPTTGKPDTTLSLYRLLAPQVLANPYPLYDRLRTEAPVHWDPFLHAWVVTRYADVVTVLHDVRFSAQRTPTPDVLTRMGLAALSPIAQVMVQQMLFMDPPAHTRLRSLAAKAFTPRRVDRLKPHIQEIVDSLLDRVQAQGRMDVIADLAYPLPAIVTAELLGVPTSDCDQLKAWSADFATMLGNFEHNPDHAPRVRRSLEEMTAYFRLAIRRQHAAPREGLSPAAGGSQSLLQALVTAEHEGDRLSEDEVIANVIITMVGGQETTTSM